MTTHDGTFQLITFYKFNFRETDWAVDKTQTHHVLIEVISELAGDPEALYSKLIGRRKKYLNQADRR